MLLYMKFPLLIKKLFRATKCIVILRATKCITIDVTSKQVTLFGPKVNTIISKLQYTICYLYKFSETSGIQSFYIQYFIFVFPQQGTIIPPFLLH